MTNHNTICAISTSPGTGAVAMIRLSGTDAVSITDKIFRPKKKGKTLKTEKANTLHYGSVTDKHNVLVDDVVIALFRAPHSFTGEDIVEITCHGALYIQQRILQLLTENGAQLAKPGEFTQRAFLNGKMDLSQAEAVADLIAASSKAAHSLALNQMKGGITSEIKTLRKKLLDFTSLVELELDFGEEDVEFASRDSLLQLTENTLQLISKLTDSFRYGNAIKNGIPVAIVGDTNVGKSTLLNLLLQEDRAIVSEIAGTTRDSIEDVMVIEGIQFRFIDTAGIRATADTVESIGIKRAYKKIEQAEIVLVMLDASAHFNDTIKFLTHLSGHLSEKFAAIIVNKIDIAAQAVVDELKSLGEATGFPTLLISAGSHLNIDQLNQFLINSAHKFEGSDSDVILTNMRHYEAFMKAGEALERVKSGLQNDISGDFLSQDIRECLHYLGEITGEISTDEVLGNIFKNFCIGK
ncbi:MAG: tRNA uridine-5-carboxymethylaminomethyl(34) synthesis GTPase MnmE [Prolixibacteraceae bacterium]|nr:tRNA uridine-5-carboxymethylaminomethyl(34) synthesis GTPase MnmE [Prolixibacteraceae bacterium]